MIDPDLFVASLWEALPVVIATILVTAALELTCIPTVKQVWKQKGGKQLYLSAIWVNFFNHFVLGLPIYATSVQLFASDRESFQWWRSLGVLLMHSAQYYTVHKSFHQSKFLYQFHSFHHKFKLHTPPVSANAVSFVEYMLAYILPFAVASIALQPTTLELRVATGIISLCNLLIHTPWLDDATASLWPVFWVRPAQHQTHHAKVNVNYSAPTFNVDWLMRVLDNGLGNKSASE